MGQQDSGAPRSLGPRGPAPHDPAPSSQTPPLQVPPLHGPAFLHKSLRLPRLVSGSSSSSESLTHELFLSWETELGQAGGHRTQWDPELRLGSSWGGQCRGEVEGTGGDTVGRTGVCGVSAKGTHPSQRLLCRHDNRQGGERWRAMRFARTPKALPAPRE